ncbi:MAG TPA: hypothetical protein VK623_12765 [Flavobacterium sp.]|nr:hypothetical protein [Flavobacterium sp.]
MKTLILSLFILSAGISLAQPKLELTPNGFAPIEIPKPNKAPEKIIEASKGWADYYNKKEHDVYDVTDNSLSIDAMKDNAFFYRNLGETYQYRIKYTLKVEFLEKTLRLSFIVKEIYTKQTLTKTTVSDFFTPGGKLKGDFEEVKPSLERTANDIINSFANFIQN